MLARSLPQDAEALFNRIPCFKRPAPKTALELLASLLGQRYSSVARVLEKSASAASHDLVRIRGYTKREVHHFWAEGLAIRLEDGKVYAVEIFGDDHPFHRRAPNAPLYPGITVGCTREEVEATLGTPSVDHGNGWIRYNDWPPQRSTCFGSTAKATVSLNIIPQPPPGPPVRIVPEGETKEKEKDKEKEKEGKGKEKAVEPEGGGGKDKGGGEGKEGGEKKKEKKKDKESKEPVGPPPPEHFGLQAIRIEMYTGGGSEEEAVAGSAKLIQAAGHELTFHKLSEGMLVKESSDIERRSYEEGLMGTGLEEFAPRCFRSVDRGSHVLLYLEDLSAAYTCPCVMDIKMGTRTFQEKEADNPKLRPDLVQKMLKVEGGAEALTPYELENGVTKLRYMQFREEQSTSATHGWRIEGIVLPDGKYPVPKTLREEAEIHTTLKAYLQGDYERARDCTERLGALRDALEASEWFMSHQVRSSTSTQARKRTITPLFSLLTPSTPLLATHTGRLLLPPHHL